MTDALLATAARLLEREALILRESNIEQPDSPARRRWAKDTEQTRREYDEMIAVAARLRARAALRDGSDVNAG